MSNEKLTGVELIAIERQEQIEKHGYNDTRDADYTGGQLMTAAEAVIEGEDGDFPAGWDLVLIQKMCDKPRLQRLIISGALMRAEQTRIENRIKEIAAEIDRLNNQ